jgi:hypothetical protein
VSRQWDFGAHGTPPAGVNFQRLRPYLQDALLHQKNKRVALAIAQRLDRDQWRAIAQFDVVGDDLDQVDLDSFSIRVEVETSDGWADLCTVHWTQLGMEWSDVTAAWIEVLRQHREGVQPGARTIRAAARGRPTRRMSPGPPGAALRAGDMPLLGYALREAAPRHRRMPPCLCSTSSGTSGPRPAPGATKS